MIPPLVFFYNDWMLLNGVSFLFIHKVLIINYICNELKETQRGIWVTFKHLRGWGIKFLAMALENRVGLDYVKFWVLSFQNPFINLKIC